MAEIFVGAQFGGEQLVVERLVVARLVVARLFGERLFRERPAVEWLVEERSAVGPDWRGSVVWRRSVGVPLVRGPRT